MEIQELKVTIGQVYEGYFNDAEEGVVGYDERLDIRPKYQREFVYKDKQRDEVIRTVMKGLPLNVIYWCKVKKEDGSDGFEVLDGQQRTISVCEYVDGTFSVDDKYFYNLPSDKQKHILDYPCSFMCVMELIPRSWIGLESSILPANSLPIRNYEMRFTLVLGFRMPNGIFQRPVVLPILLQVIT